MVAIAATIVGRVTGLVDFPDAWDPTLFDPIDGVVVTAGIPELEEAVELIDELTGMRDVPAGPPAAAEFAASAKRALGRRIVRILAGDKALGFQARALFGYQLRCQPHGREAGHQLGAACRLDQQESAQLQLGFGQCGAVEVVQDA